MRINVLKFGTTAAAVLLVSSVAVQAVPTVRYNDGTAGGILTVADNGLGDNFSSIDGLIWSAYSHGVWSVSTTLASTKPNTGSAQQPIMDLNFTAQIRPTGPTAGSLNIQFSDLDYDLPSSLAFLSSIGGTFANTGFGVTWNAYYGPANTLFGHGTLIAGLGPLAGGVGSFGDDAVGVAVTPGSPVSLTLELIITQNGTGGNRALITGNGSLAALPDGGSTVGMLGLALLGIGLLVARQKHVQRVS